MNSTVVKIMMGALCALCLTSCAQEPYGLKKIATEYPPVQRRLDLIGLNYQAVDSMVAQVKPYLPAQAPIIVSTVVNINYLESSAPLGRVISEHVLGRLAQAGYGVIEIKVRNQVYLKRHEGEFLLTREIRDLARSHNAQALIVGTYAEASDRIFVSLKAIEAEGGRIIGAVDYSIHKDDVIRSLLSRS